MTSNGRSWIHFFSTDNKIGGRVFESYGTLIDPKTVFFVIGSYWENIRKDPTWFESRRALLRSIRNNVAVDSVRAITKRLTPSGTRSKIRIAILVDADSLREYFISTRNCISGLACRDRNVSSSWRQR